MPAFTIWTPDSKLAALYSGQALALVATKAEEVPDDGLNSLSFTPTLRHQRMPGQPEWNTRCTVHAGILML